MASCLDESTLMDYVEGLLSGEALQRAEEHLDGCAACRQAMVDAAGTAPSVVPWGPASPPVPPLLPDLAMPAPGTQVGRYVLLERLGAGGMGVVYSASDPTLGRKVAIKLLRADLTALSGASERMLREAQSLARLSHPNVVSVYDSGLHLGSVFMAMELVVGQTLKQWLAQERHPWRAVLEVFLAAGRGLEAAHAAGLIHRDFKPDNVLVGADGGVRVTDFGLARPLSALGERAGANALPPLALDAPQGLTVTGTLVGTPAYMAPEQLRGEAPSAQSDQFGFCIALYEGLYGQRPFQGATEQDVRAGRMPEPPGNTRVPARVRRAVLRGLSPRPEDRHPSMGALLLELERARRSALRSRLVFGAIGASMLLAAVGGYLATNRAHARRCTGAERKLAGIWDEQRKGEIRAAFLAAGQPFAQAAFDSVARSLEPYASSLVRMQTEACEATRIYAEQTEEQLALRTSCLEQRLRELGALTELLAKADGQVVRKAPGAARSLEALDRCADLAALASDVRPPADPAVRARVEALRGRLAEVNALQKTGRYARGLELAQQLVQELDGLEYSPLQAQAYFALGILQRSLSRPKEAERSLHRAVWAADEGRVDELRAQAWIMLINVAGVENARLDDGRLAVEHATSTLRRLGRDRVPRLEALFHSNLGSLYRHAGELDRAAAEFREALALRERVFGPDSPEVADVAASLGYVLLQQQRLSEALALFERAIATARRTIGSDHPDLAIWLTKLGLVQGYRGEAARAREALLEALAINERTVGKDHASNAEALQYLAYLLYPSSPEESLAFARRAVKLMEAAYGPEHPDTMVMRNSEALSLAALGRDREAVQLGRVVFAAFEKAYPPGHPNVLAILVDLGQWEARAGRLAEAREHLGHAQQLLGQKGTPGAELVGHLQLGLGELELRSGHPDRALAHLRQAIEACERAGPFQPELGDSLAGASEALLQLGRPGEAMALLQRASELKANMIRLPARARLKALNERALVALRAEGRSRQGR